MFWWWWRLSKNRSPWCLFEISKGNRDWMAANWGNNAKWRSWCPSLWSPISHRLQSQYPLIIFYYFVNNHVASSTCFLFEITCSTWTMYSSWWLRQSTWVSVTLSGRPLPTSVQAELVVEDIPIGITSTTVTIPNGISTTALEEEIFKKIEKASRTRSHLTEMRWP